MLPHKRQSPPRTYLAQLGHTLTNAVLTVKSKGLEPPHPLRSHRRVARTGRSSAFQMYSTPREWLYTHTGLAGTHHQGLAGPPVGCWAVWGAGRR